MDVVGGESPIYKHMRQSPIYDPHVLPILLSFIPSARVLEYSMDAGQSLVAVTSIHLSLIPYILW
jgi:hypothetical protein